MPRMRLPLLLGITYLATAALAGCGSSSGDDAAKFVGTWAFASGSNVTATCSIGTMQPMSLDLGGLSVTITKVDNSDIIAEAGGPTCRIKFSVKGSMATAVPGQICTIPQVMFMGIVPDINVSSWTLTSANGALTTMLSGTALVCTATGGGTLVPASPSDGGGASD